MVIDQELFKTLRLDPNFQLVLAQAVSELDLEAKQRGDTVINHYTENTTYQDNTFNVTQTTYMYLYLVQGAEDCSWRILAPAALRSRREPSKSYYFTLQGQSNAEKRRSGQNL